MSGRDKSALSSPPAASRIPEISERLLQDGNPEKASGMQRFFKTGPGQYGEGDRFIGLSTPQVRRYIQDYRDLSLAELDGLLQSPYHEFRTLSLAILVLRYGKSGEAAQNEIFSFYLAHTARINNWDLVDISAPGIVGQHLLKRDRAILRKLAASHLLWEQRIAVVSTLTFIRNGEFADTLELVSSLLKNPHDLMRKACGWMLREVGKRDQGTLTAFLEKNKAVMPRTMLRYAIEHYPESRRKEFMAK